MHSNPIPIILLFLFLKNHQGIQIPAISTLQLESLLDNARMMLNAYDKLNGFMQSGSASVPDMKKVMEIVEKLPL